MTSVGVRELRQHASELLRRVGNGETVEVTDRGQPVALLTPIPQGSRIEQLEAAGDLEVATDDPGDLPDPVALADDVEPPSHALDRLRRDER